MKCFVYCTSASRSCFDKNFDVIGLFNDRAAAAVAPNPPPATPPIVGDELIGEDADIMFPF